MRKITILILTAQYIPAYKAGGQVKTISELIEYLGDEFDFKVICSDRDLGGLRAFGNISVNKWQRVGKAEVFYLSPGRKNIRGLRQVINSIKFDLLYLNSFFDPWFTVAPLFLRYLKSIRNTPVIVAPHGEFSSGAIRIKKFKKYCYLALTKFLGLYKGICWQASSNFERNDILRELRLKPSANFNINNTIIIAPDIIPEHLTVKCPDALNSTKTKSEVLKIVFLSRICVKKNLVYALKILREVRSRVDFDIYGPIDQDQGYWNKCKRLIETMPANIKTRYLGPIEPSKINTTFAMYDLFLFPTFGENFGYVIIESLRNGCPVLISDQTPWADLEKHKAGWICALDRPECFIETIEKLAIVSNQEYQSFYDNAMRYPYETINHDDTLKKNRQMFLACCISKNEP